MRGPRFSRSVQGLVEGGASILMEEKKKAYVYLYREEVERRLHFKDFTLGSFRNTSRTINRYIVVGCGNFFSIFIFHLALSYTRGRITFENELSLIFKLGLLAYENLSPLLICSFHKSSQLFASLSLSRSLALSFSFSHRHHHPSTSRNTRRARR